MTNDRAVLSPLYFTSEITMPNKKKKTSKSRSAVSHAQLVNQVRLLTLWVRVLKGNAHLGGWTLSRARGRYKPDPTGGPPNL